MKIQFCVNGDFNGHPNIVAEFDVAEAPTEDQCKLIENNIAEAISTYEEENDDFEEFDGYQVCYNACKKHLKLVDNPVVHTFYI